MTSPWTSPLQGHIAWGFRIEGCGPHLPGDFLDPYYFVTEKPYQGTASGTPANAFVVFPEGTGLPSWSWSVDFKTGSSTIGSTMLTIAPGDGDLATIQALFQNLRPVAVDELAASVARLDNYITLASGNTGREGEVLWCGREAIYLQTHVGSPNGKYTVGRGVYGSFAVPHTIGVNETQLYDSWVALPDSLVTIGYCNEFILYQMDYDSVGYTAFSNDDFAPIWTGVIGDVGSNDGGQTFVLPLSGVEALTTTARLYPEPWLGEIVSEPDRAIWIVKQVFPAGQRTYTHPAGMGQTPSVGDQCWVSVDDSACLMELEKASGDIIYVIDPNLTIRGCSPPGDPGDGIVTELISSHPEQPTTGSGLTALPLGDPVNYGDVVTVTLQILTSTAHGNNGSYDIGIKLGPQIPAAQIDITGAEALRDTWLGSVSHVERVWLGNWKPKDRPLAKEYVEQKLLAPFGLVLTTDANGLYAIKALDDFPDDTSSIPTVTDSVLLEGTGFRYGLGYQRTVDRVELEYKATARGDTRTLTVNDTVTRERRLNQAGPLSVDAGVVGTRDQAVGLLYQHLARWRNQLTYFEFDTPCTWNYAPGDAFYVTTNQLPGVTVSTGVPSQGVTAQLSYLDAKTVHLGAGEGSFTYRAVMVGIDTTGLGRIAPALEVKAGWTYSVGTGIVAFTNNLFQSGTGYKYDDDVEPFLADFVLRHCDQYGDFISGGAAGIVVGSTDVTGANNNITFSSYPAAWDTGSPPVSGDIFMFAAWDNQTTAQQAYVSLADANAVLGTGDDDPFYYI